ncbi:MAG: lipoyl(octanoyl) transferase LipB, partial [Actinomycetota bacterium]
MNRIVATWVGRVAYEPAWELQRLVAELRAEERLPDTMLLLEHDHVYTLGKRGSESEILFDEAERASRGVEVVRSDRGGLVTYHGPGQLVGYPIFNLGPKADIVGFVCRLENTMIGAAARLGVQARRVDGLPGV